MKSIPKVSPKIVVRAKAVSIQREVMPLSPLFWS